MNKKKVDTYKKLVREQSNLTGRAAAKKEKEIIKFMRDSLTPQQKNAVNKAYKENQTRIADFTPGMSDKNRKQGFYDNVAATMFQKGIGAREAITKQLNSANYMKKYDVLRNNALTALRGDKAAYSEWRRLLQHKKFDFDKLSYIGDNTYEYKVNDNYSAVIAFTNSPEAVRVWRRNSEAFTARHKPKTGGKKGK